jgi:hypothetical protein
MIMKTRLKVQSSRSQRFLCIFAFTLNTQEEKFPFMCVLFVNSQKNEKNIEQQNTKKNISMRVWLIYRFFLFSSLERLEK